MTNNKFVLNWIDEMAAMTKPDKIVWIDGSEAQAEALRAEACSTGEMIKLNEELLPNCYLHRTAINDVARVEGRTFICTSKKEDAGNINNWMDPQECYAKLSKLYNGSMKGRTMYVIPYSMSIVGSPFAKYGIELTDSIYVVLNMLIMTRVGTVVLEALGVKNVIKLNCEPTGHFAHNPEPLPEHLTEISDALKNGKADVGFVVDPDVDRLAIVMENGEMFVEEYTLVSIADYVLSQTPGATVSNLSSSRALRDITLKMRGSSNQRIIDLTKK